MVTVPVEGPANSLSSRYPPRLREDQMIKKHTPLDKAQDLVHAPAMVHTYGPRGGKSRLGGLTTANNIGACNPLHFLQWVFSCLHAPIMSVCIWWARPTGSLCCQVVKPDTALTIGVFDKASGEFFNSNIGGFEHA